MTSAVVLAVTSDYIFSAANVIIGIEAKSPNFCNEYIIFVEDLEKVDNYEICALQMCVPLQKKVKILDSRSIIPEFSNNSSVLEKFLGRYSKMALVKVYMPRLFIDSSLTGTNQYDYLLWLDSDTLILDDISRILDNGLVCGCMGNIEIDKLTNKKLFTCLDGSDVKPNGGVILYKRQFIDILTNEGIDYFSIVDETLTELISTNQQFIDEFTICISLKKTKQDKCYLTVIGNEYNCDPRYFYYNNPKIVHSVGGGSKFWNNPLMNRFFPNWEKK